MREFQVKKKVRSVLYSKITATMLVIGIILIGKATWGVFKKERESFANAVQAARELERLEDRKNLLQAEIARLGTEVGIEEEIRAKYNVGKPGEKFFIIVDNNPTTTATTTPKQNWWSKVQKMFGI